MKMELHGSNRSVHVELAAVVIAMICNDECEKGDGLI